MKYIDLFAGIGGFHYGIERACPSGHQFPQSETERKGLEMERSLHPRQESNAVCVYSNEWDKYANSVYRRHYGECDNRDIRTVEADEIPEHDLLVGGFPCQSFSIAGKRGGFDDTRGTLFFEIARILRAKRTRLCILENVKGLLSHDEGRTFGTIISTLDELGYDTQWQVLNSKNFGVPQNRERVFIIGHLRGTRRPEIFPITENGGLSHGAGESEKGSPQTELSTTIRSTIWKVKADDTFIRETQKLSDAMRVRSVDGDAVTLKGLGGGMGAKTGSYETVTGIRRLTPIECERLQGFPDNWTKYGADGELISDTQRYKMCGNAVTTNVITEIVKRLAFP